MVTKVTKLLFSGLGFPMVTSNKGYPSYRHMLNNECNRLPGSSTIG